MLTDDIPNQLFGILMVDDLPIGDRERCLCGCWVAEDDVLRFFILDAAVLCMYEGVAPETFTLPMAIRPKGSLLV